jgi:hypothetical protein
MNIIIKSNFKQLAEFAEDDSPSHFFYGRGSQVGPAVLSEILWNFAGRKESA